MAVAYTLAAKVIRAANVVIAHFISPPDFPSAASRIFLGSA
jgi:hypothetical protein